jgi:hypothetical protein
VVLALGLAACSPAPPGGPPADAATAVHAAPVPDAPAGDVSGPVTFEWRDPAPGAVYRVSVFDGEERLLSEWDTRERRVAAPPDLGPWLRDGGTFLWRVAALDAAGQPVRTSALVRFTVRAP